jgi:hypothetical protein
MSTERHESEYKLWSIIAKNAALRARSWQVAVKARSSPAHE